MSANRHVVEVSACGSARVFDEAAVLALLKENTYEEVSSITKWSRGKIWHLAKRLGVRKTEARILERASERKQRQLDELNSLRNTTVKEDVMDFLESLPDECVKLHFTSCPYNIGKKYGDGHSADAMMFTRFHGWMMSVISEMSRTLQVGGVVCLNVGKTVDWDGQMIPLDVVLYDSLKKSGLTFQSRIVWTAPHGLTPTGRLADRYETILVFSKGDTPTFNANAARTPQKNPGKRAYKGANKGELSGNPYGAAPTDVWSDIPTVRHNHPDRSHGAHPAQFPVNLAMRAILLYSMPGDLICDCFIGSGSTAVAAVKSGRDFTGCDLFYMKLRESRLERATLDSFSPLPGVSDDSVAIWQAEAVKKNVKGLTISAAEDKIQCEALGISETTKNLDLFL